MDMDLRGQGFIYNFTICGLAIDLYTKVSPVKSNVQKADVKHVPIKKYTEKGYWDPITRKHYPVLAAFNNGCGGLAAWCPWCCDWHHHSAGDGHRQAHCRGITPFSETGYILREVKVSKSFKICRFKTV